MRTTNADVYSPHFPPHTYFALVPKHSFPESWPETFSKACDRELFHSPHPLSLQGGMHAQLDEAFKGADPQVLQLCKIGVSIIALTLRLRLAPVGSADVSGCEKQLQSLLDAQAKLVAALSRRYGQ